MWRDRFVKSSQPTPSSSPPQSRSFTPVPQRGPSFNAANHPSLTTRPALNPRSTSLASLAAVESTLSLPNTARLPNGSALRNEIGRASTPVEVEDPLKVLEAIVGKPNSRKRRSDGSPIPHTRRPEDLITEIDFRGLSLEEFAVKPVVESSDTQHDEKGHRRTTGQGYTEDKARFEDLHASISACDKVLDSVESYLQAFQADLGNVSAEIETLQTRSTEMNARLENRKVVEKLLGPAVEDFSVNPTTVRKIMNGPMDDGWSKALAELERKAKAVEARQKDETCTIKAIEDVVPLLQDLRNRAIERIRDHFVSQIKALRSPNINAQIIQQNGFLKFKDLYVFLAKHQKQLAEEIGQAYTNTMRWYYLHHFTRYETVLKAMKLHNIDRTETLGSIDDASLLSSRRRAPAVYDAFSLGRRMDVLKPTSSTNSGALSTYLIEEDKGTHFMEDPFHNLNLALIDNLSFEYTFLTTFFAGAKPYPAITRTFDTIFSPTFQLAQNMTKTLVENSADALGILLCVRINQHHAFELQRRKVPVAEGYINGTNILLWPRFQQVMDLHSESLRKAATSTPSRMGFSAASLLSGGLGGGIGSSNNANGEGGAGGNSASQQAAASAPHPITQRFANFLAALVALSSPTPSSTSPPPNKNNHPTTSSPTTSNPTNPYPKQTTTDIEPVSNSLKRLISDFEALLTRLSKSQAGSDTRKRERFLFNNYSLVVTILESVLGFSSNNDVEDGDILGDEKGSRGGGMMEREVRGHFETLRDGFVG